MMCISCSRKLILTLNALLHPPKPALSRRTRAYIAESQEAGPAQVPFRLACFGPRSANHLVYSLAPRMSTS
ncbi:hypothetical protein F5Y19DRAFT_443099 [Xylariaceae sp. FL1651]|nr:hypothetical protein F5Y19DRAFT_443099 [Xylariaceae sp. FL1651]